MMKKKIVLFLIITMMNGAEETFNPGPEDNYVRK